jgi:flagellar biosynthetic protein FliO
VPLLAVLAVLLAAAAAFAWYARRRGLSFPLQGRVKRLRVVERLALSRRSALVVVEYQGRTLLLGQSGDQITLISDPGSADHEPG